MTYRVPSDIAWVFDEREDRSPVLYLMQVPDGVPLVLTGTGALIWLFAAQGDDVVATLKEAVQDPPADLPETAASYLADLVRHGLLAVAGSTSV